MTALLAALALMLVGIVALVVDVRWVMRACRTADVTHDTSPMRSDTAGVTPNTAGMT
jgi:hypothetical protein